MDQERDDSGFDEVMRALITPECRQNPYPLYAGMRRELPVYCSGHGMWYLTRYADVDAALADVRLSNDREMMARALSARQGGMERMSRLVRRLGNAMTNTDPPEHTRLRRLVSSGFTARQIEGLRPRIQAMADRLLDTAIAAGSSMDLVAAVAFPLTFGVICELFGIPHGDRERVGAWFQAMVSPSAAADLDQLEQVVEQFDGYLTGLIRERRAQPGEDVISALVASQERDDRLSDEELLATCLVVFTGGVETTSNLIGNGMLGLLRHPVQLQRLQREPTLIRSAVQELARYDTPTQMVIRVVADTLEVGGQTLEAGALVYLVLAAANRDPERFSDPDRLDLDRGEIRNLSFGASRHHCVGAPLARLQGEIAIGTLLRRLPNLGLDTDVVQYRPNPLLRGPACLLLGY